MSGDKSDSLKRYIAEEEEEEWYDLHICDDCEQHVCCWCCSNYKEEPAVVCVAEYDFTTAVNTRRHDRKQRELDDYVSRRKSETH